MEASRGLRRQREVEVEEVPLRPRIERGGSNGSGGAAQQKEEEKEQTEEQEEDY